jgi:hypothetical protein
VHVPKAHVHYLNFKFFPAGVTTLTYVFAELVSLDLSSG